MKSIVFFYKHPITWVLILVLLQVWIAFILSPPAEQYNLNKANYEQAVSLAGDNSELIEIIKYQSNELFRYTKVTTALTDMLKYIGGLSALFLFIHLMLACRKERAKQQ